MKVIGAKISDETFEEINNVNLIRIELFFFFIIFLTFDLYILKIC